MTTLFVFGRSHVIVSSEMHAQIVAPAVLESYRRRSNTTGSKWTEHVSMTPVQKILTVMAIALATVLSHAQWQQPTDTVPAYYGKPPSSSNIGSRILSGKQLTEAHFKYPFQIAAYKKAAQVQILLYQLPCYCRCDRALGHKSLHSCFEGPHGATCTTCMKESVYAYEMSRKGKSIREIREGIERGNWLDISDADNTGN
jgi:hypothetical protein